MKCSGFSRRFGRNIRIARKRSGITQSELAEKAGVVTQTISSYECGRTEPDLIRLLIISNVLSVSINDLISDALSVPIEDIIQGLIPGGEDAEAEVVEGNRT